MAEGSRSWGSEWQILSLLGCAEAVEPPPETTELPKSLLFHRPSGIAAHNPVHSRLVSATISQGWGQLAKNNTCLWWKLEIPYTSMPNQSKFILTWFVMVAPWTFHVQVNMSMCQELLQYPSRNSGQSVPQSQGWAQAAHAVSWPFQPRTEAGLAICVGKASRPAFH